MSDHTRLSLTSLAPNQGREDVLKSLFPEVFTEGKIDYERLKQALGASIQTDRERYGLNWAGKSDAVHALRSLSIGTLEPVREQSVSFDEAKNLVIEGDNLEVLKLLQSAYFGKVKLVYIDPPYNTGGEFIYPDNFREGLDDYLRFSGQMSAEGTVLTTNKEGDGRYHSKWLSMMYPRLFLAKNLLREDGVIFISIDDHEVHNLRLMMNEIFGEESFVAQIIWEKRSGPPNDKAIGEVHEYLLVYAKNPEQLSLNLLPRTEEDKLRFKNPDEDPNGPWVAGDLSANAKGGRFVASLYYEIENPATGQKHLPPQGACWRFSSDKIKGLIEEGKIFFGSDGQGRPKIKRYLDEVRDGFTVPTIWKGLATNAHARSEIFSLFADNSIFETPKPVELIKQIIQVGAGSDGIILDFFAGSGTTAQAVLELNAEDGGERKFILIQLPELTKNKEFPTIADIMRERVRRVVAKMDDDKADHLDLGSTSLQVRGFKALRLTHSNFKIWDGDDDSSNSDALVRQLELFADNLRPEAEPEGILFEILLKSGYDPNVSREQIPVAGQSAYSINNGTLLVCLERKVSRETLEAMVAHNPKPVLVICLDEAFQGDDALLTNGLLQMQDAGIQFQTV